MNSDTFRQADALRRMLGYLGEKSLSGEAEHLKEYTVGVEVFGKPEDYDPQRDASVRMQGSKLRQKLEEYYRTEGKDDPVIIRFPKGRFKLAFEARRAVVAAPSGPAKPGRWQILSAVLAVALLTTGSLALWQWRSGAHPSGVWTPELEALWFPVLSDKRPILVTFGTGVFIRSPVGFFRSPVINEWSQAVNSPLLSWMRDDLRSGNAMPVYIYSGVGEVSAAFELGRLLGSRRRDLSIKRSIVTTWQDIVNSNVVFLGSPKSVFQTKDIPVTQDLVMADDAIHNLSPRPGEPTLLRGDWPLHSPYVVEDYALISRLPGLQGRGEILIIGAYSTEGTDAAVQYVTRPDLAREFVRRIRLPSGELPEYFQAVVKARFKDMVPVELAYQFHHVLTPARRNSR